MSVILEIKNLHNREFDKVIDKKFDKLKWYPQFFWKDKFCEIWTYDTFVDRQSLFYRVLQDGLISILWNAIMWVMQKEQGKLSVFRSNEKLDSRKPKMTISFSIFLFPDSYYNSWIEAEDVCTSDTSSDTSSSVVSCKANTKINETHHQAKRKDQEDSLLKLNDFEVPSIYSNGVSDSWCEDASSTNRFVLKIMFVFNNHVIFR